MKELEESETFVFHWYEFKNKVKFAKIVYNSESDKLELKILN